MAISNLVNVSRVAAQHMAAQPRPQAFEAAAKFLGLSKKELRDQLNRGRSIADLAKAQGKKTDDLRKAMLQAVSVDQQNYYAPKIDQMIQAREGQNQSPAPSATSGKQTSDAFNSIADFLGLSKQEMSSQIDQGKSLADLARAQGKGVDGLKQTILNSVPAGQRATLSQDVEQLIQGHLGDVADPATNQHSSQTVSFSATSANSPSQSNPSVDLYA